MATTEGQSFDIGPYEKIKLCVSVTTNLIKIQEHEYSLDAQFFFLYQSEIDKMATKTGHYFI